ncbi:MAG: potassium channel family protein [Acidobacteriota bacterium]
MSARKRLYLAFALLSAVVFIGATGFHYLESWPWFDGLYMTLITITTVGYGETHPLSPEGKLFNMFLILMAVTAGGFLITTSTQAMLQFELRHFLGRRRMQRELARLRDHYVICGAGRVGRTVARELHDRGVAFAIVEKDPDRARWAIEQGYPIVIGNAHSEADLRRALIDNAVGLVAAVTSDAENLYIVLTARGMNPGLKIIARASEEEATPKLLAAGATEVVSPYHFVGRRIAHLLLQPHVIDFLEAAFGNQRLDVQLEEVDVPAGSGLAGKSLAATEIRQNTGVLVIALRRPDGSLDVNPGPGAVIHAGDCLIAVGSAEHLKKLGALARA